MYYEALLLDTYTLRIVMPSWTTDLLIMQHLSLYLIFIALNLPSEVNIAILTLFPVVLAYLSPSFYF